MELEQVQFGHLRQICYARYMKLYNSLSPEIELLSILKGSLQIAFNDLS